MDLISTYAQGVSELANFCKDQGASPLVVDVIVNPRAGFFKRRTTVQRLIAELERRLAELRDRSPRHKVEINTVHYTEYAGHARIITEQILTAEDKARYGLEHLLVGCGGDGTSNEICTALVSVGGTVLDRLKLLRLPLGTGNDMADAQTFGEAYDLILGPQKSDKTGALLLTSAGRRIGYAFNIASIGIDAFVADLTNRFKRAIPGHAYKALVNVGALFYDQNVKQLPMDVKIVRGEKETVLRGFVPSMVVVGVSGHRTYGGHMAVLPGEENVCVIDHLGVFAKMKSKSLLYEGRHAVLPQVSFHTADRVECMYNGRIPVQLDGETSWLGPSDFPLTIEVLPPSIRVLRV